MSGKMNWDRVRKESLSLSRGAQRIADSDSTIAALEEGRFHHESTTKRKRGRKKKRNALVRLSREWAPPLQAARRTAPRVIAKQQTGTLKSLDPNAGYGHILSENDKELFFRASAIRGTELRALHLGDAVQFDLARSAKGLHEAVNVGPRKVEP